MSLTKECSEWLLQHPIALVGIIIAIILVYIYMCIPATGPNPLQHNSVRPPKPLVVDQAKRDAVIKQGFTAQKVPDDLDAILIGSGMGSLASAALLAKVGKKCLVLEQHDQAGGCLHTFIEKGFEFDIGVHYIGEMEASERIRILMDQLTDGQLQWEMLDDAYDVVVLGKGDKVKDYPHVTGRDRWRAKMISMFPDEVKAIDKYLAMSNELKSETYFAPMILLKVLPRWLCNILWTSGIFGLFSNFFRYNRKTLLEGLGELTENEDLKAVLTYNWGDYGTVPTKGAFGMHVSLFNHFLEGAYYPRGGSSEFAMHMIPVIEKAGGRVLVRAPVSQILIDDSGRATGVRVSRTGGDTDIFAPLIISDAGVMNTFNSLLPPEVAMKSPIYKMIEGEQVRSGVGAFSLFVGMNGTAEELGLKGQNLWVYPGSKISDLCEDYFESSIDEVMSNDIPLLFASFPSAKDPTFLQKFPGKSTCVIVTMANYKWFEQWEEERVKKRGQVYEDLKQEFAKKMWNQFTEQYPHLRDKVEYLEGGSPVTNKYYINAPKGEIYGIEHDMARYTNPEIIQNLRPDTGIPGLYLTGQDIIMGGVVGALIGSMVSTGVILNRNVYFDLLTLRRKIMKNK